MKKLHHVKAFTLIELLVVLRIIALLIGILLPALGAARRSARELACLTQVRSFTQGMFIYQADHGVLPTWARSIGDGDNFKIGGRVWAQTMIEDGYLGSDATFDAFRCPLVFGDWDGYLQARGGTFASREGYVTNYAMSGPVGGYFNRINNPEPPPPGTSISELFVGYSSDDVFETSSTMLTAEKGHPFSLSNGAERIGSTIVIWGNTHIAHPHGTIGTESQNLRNKGFFLREVEGTTNMGMVDGSAAAQKGEMSINSNGNNGRVQMANDGSGWEDDSLILNPFDPDEP